jgi:hypothetical protein
MRYCINKYLLEEKVLEKEEEFRNQKQFSNQYIYKMRIGNLFINNNNNNNNTLHNSNNHSNNKYNSNNINHNNNSNLQDKKNTITILCLSRLKKQKTLKKLRDHKGFYQKEIKMFINL